jgi:POT family proton-dependent oligopeptide transporter
MLEIPNASLIGLVVAMLLIGTGTGGVRSVYFPFLGDQYQRRSEEDPVQERDGVKETIDYGLTLQSIYNICYG